MVLKRDKGCVNNVRLLRIKQTVDNQNEVGTFLKNKLHFC